MDPAAEIQLAGVLDEAVSGEYLAPQLHLRGDMPGEGCVEVEELLGPRLQDGVDAVPVILEERGGAVGRDDCDAVLVKPLAGIVDADVTHAAAAYVVVADRDLQGLDSPGGIDGAAVAPGLFLIALASVDGHSREAGQDVEVLNGREVSSAQQRNAGVT